MPPLLLPAKNVCRQPLAHYITNSAVPLPQCHFAVSLENAMHFLVRGLRPIRLPPAKNVCKQPLAHYITNSAVPLRSVTPAVPLRSVTSQCHSKMQCIFSFAGFALSVCCLPKMSASSHFVMQQTDTAHCFRVHYITNLTVQQYVQIFLFLKTHIFHIKEHTVINRVLIVRRESSYGKV